MATTIVFETHSTTTDNEKGLATGWLPGELSNAGKAQARELGLRRGADGISAVFTSDLARAVETARIAFEDSAIPLLEDSRLRECNYGDWNGIPRAQWRDPRIYIARRFPGGESYSDVIERTRAFLNDLRRDRDAERVLLIAHSANMWALEHVVKGEDLEALVGRSFDWQPGWEYVVGCDLISSHH